MGKLRRRLAPGALLLLGVLAGLAGAEGILRLRGVRYNVTAPHPDPDLGYTLRPNLRARIEGADHAYNRIGLRDRDYPEEPAPGTRRILVVGDSITYAQSTPLEATYVKRLESALVAGGGAWEILNGGVAGYNACQEEAFHRLVGSRYHPHLVLWQYCLNDAGDAWAPYGPGGRGWVPLPAGWKRALRERLYLWSFARFHAAGTLHLLGLAPRDTSDLDYARRVFAFYGGPDARRLDRALACVRRARDLAAAGGGRMLVAIVPFSMQVDGDLAFPDRPQREVARRCREAGIPVLDLLPTFREARAGSLFAPGDFVHLSPEGHAAAARALEPEVRRLFAEAPASSAAGGPGP
jgi:lysophospholipase L1-like esterase